MKPNPLLQLAELGQSIWLDYIQRTLMSGGGLKKFIDEDGLKGMTSNPSLFEKAIAESKDYDDDIKKMADQDIATIYETLTQTDVQMAADIFRDLYDKTNGQDGYVSLEVNPHLAHDTQGTIEEARRLWQALNRPNVLIKVPATREGILAIKQLISEGINVNVTLLFGLPRYEEVAHAYIAGLEARLAQGLPIKSIASVASFFLSRIDVLVDPLLKDSQGTVAIASARIAYQMFKELFNSDRFQKLAAQGAHVQRLLWASTSTKNPDYSDVKYVEALIGPQTVNTLPLETLNAYRDHGNPKIRIEEDLDKAKLIFQQLPTMNIDIDKVTQQLEDEGVEKFIESFDKLIAAISHKSKNIIQRLWQGDPTLWTNSDENKWLGWLNIAQAELSEVDRINNLAQEIKAAGFTDIVLLGMGGSSLCPAMLAKTFGKIDDYPKLHILDSTDPLQILHLEQRIDLQHTFFIVSSKSGTTLEPNIFKKYFYQRLQTVFNKTNVGDRFLAITDPGTALDILAKNENFKTVFYGKPSIGGRYSALSNFGMAPFGLMGGDVKNFLSYASIMAQACRTDNDNPGLILGQTLGLGAQQGKNKVTLIVSPGIQSLGGWLEQLLAESTGKQGKGLIPVDQEPLGAPNVYGNDRLFIYIRLESAPDLDQDNAIAALEKAGQSVVRSHIMEKNQLGAELFKWEIATAIAGSILKINPFNQPDVEASKIRAQQLTTEYEQTGKISQPKPFFEENHIALFTDANNEKALSQSLKGQASITNYLRAHFNRIQEGDYVDLSAFIEMTDAHTALLQQSRIAIRDAKKVATCLGFGPRFLHSTGQVYKGGPNTGVFLQITTDHPQDIQIPGEKYSFGLVINVQAQGDFEVLTQRSRRALRIHLKNDVHAGLQQLHDHIKKALNYKDNHE